MLTCVINRKQLKAAFLQEIIWNPNDLSDDTLREQILRQYHHTVKAQVAFRWICYLTALSRYIVVSFGHLPLTNRCEMDQNLYWFSLCVQSIYLLEVIFVVGALDTLFLATCAIIMTQFKIASHVLQSMDYTSSAVPISQKNFVRKYLKLER